MSQVREDSNERTYKGDEERRVGLGLSQVVVGHEFWSERKFSAKKDHAKKMKRDPKHNAKNSQNMF
jgi:hypothetical protein